MARKIEVDYLARVEGEGGLSLVMEDGKVVEAALKIFEPPRFFEAFLRGRDFRETPDITARICGICPVAYQMSSVHALEAIHGGSPQGAIRALRRLLYCGEWIESHVLHIYMLHAPDFLGYAGAVELAQDHPDRVKMGLRLKKLGNRLVQVVGGREIHPINVKVGGFYRLPKQDDLNGLADELRWAHDAAEDTLRWVSGLDFPEISRSYNFVSLAHPDEYPLNEGRVRSTSGLDLTPDAWADAFEEVHVARSNALHSRLKGGGNYFVGPIARLAHNLDRLPPGIRRHADALGVSGLLENPFRSIQVRALEVIYAIEEAQRILSVYQPPKAAAVDIQPQAGVGSACTEAPRGILFHQYRLDDAGLIESARIVPPTSQNQATIEEDLVQVAEAGAELDDDALRWRCEQAIRNYDPCISCATHFLDLTVERR